MITIHFKVFRVEDRRNADAVDFWDFLTEGEADQWNNDELNLNGAVRELTRREIIETALATLHQDLLDNARPA